MAFTPTPFAFSFDPRFRWPLAALGVSPGRASVGFDDDDFVVRFGPWSLRTPVANLAGAEQTGPYQAYRVIGPHLSFADRGVSFGTNTTAGACIRFTEPVAALDPTGRLRHPGATVTVEDVDGLVGLVTGLTA